MREEPRRKEKRNSELLKKTVNAKTPCISIPFFLLFFANYSRSQEKRQEKNSRKNTMGIPRMRHYPSPQHPSPRLSPRPKASDPIQNSSSKLTSEEKKGFQLSGSANKYLIFVTFLRSPCTSFANPLPRTFFYPVKKNMQTKKFFFHPKGHFCVVNPTLKRTRKKPHPPPPLSNVHARTSRSRKNRFPRCNAHFFGCRHCEGRMRSARTTSPLPAPPPSMQQAAG
jgi:hypothetical protein